MSMEALGLAIGTDASTISKLEKGKIRLTQDRIQKIAKALEVAAEDVLGATSTGDRELLTHETDQQNAMIPVLGSAAGSHRSGAFQLLDGPIEYMDAPPQLKNTRGIYALYVDGSSMDPMFKHGEKVLVSQYRPPRLGDAVVVQEQHEKHSPVLASIGILRNNSYDELAIQKLNPIGLVKIKGQYVRAVHRVISYAELID